MPSTRRVALGALCALVAIPAVVSAQPGTGLEDPNLSPVGRSGSGFFGTLIIGGLLVALAPDYVEALIERIHDDTGGCFAWGIAIGILFIVAIVVLIFTVIGILLAIPLAIAFGLIAAAGNAVGYIALFDNFVDNRWIALLIGAIIAGVAGAIPLVGGLLGFIVGSLGLGAIVLDYRKN
ncbi:MAG: hypothetical protein ABEJ35_07825 [Halobacteriaceae archaeon]